MILACLRGLLKPYYDQGLRSIIRERMVLNALALEKDVEFQLKQLQLESSFASFFQPAKATTILRQMVAGLQRLRKNAEFDLLAKVMPQLRGSIDAIAKLFHALEAAGILKDSEEPLSDD